MVSIFLIPLPPLSLIVSIFRTTLPPLSVMVCTLHFANPPSSRWLFTFMNGPSVLISKIIVGEKGGFKHPLVCFKYIAMLKSYWLQKQAQAELEKDATPKCKLKGFFLRTFTFFLFSIRLSPFLFPLSPLPFTLYPLPCTLYPLPFTLYPLPFTLYLLPFSI